MRTWYDPVDYMRAKAVAFTVAVISVALARGQTEKISAVDLFGTTGVDVQLIRRALPVHEGDPFPKSDHAGERLVAEIKDAVEGVAGAGATDVALSCCEYKGGFTVFIGLPGTAVRHIAYSPPPNRGTILPDRGLEAYERAMDAVLGAQQNGASQDDSHAHSLSGDRTLRDSHLAMKRYALTHERAIRLVLGASRYPRQRAAAAWLLGYSRHPELEVAQLVLASRDSNNVVRNNAVRSLAVIAGADIRVARRIPAAPFIELLYSGSWHDRDKAAFLLDALSTGHDPNLLQTLRAEALPPLLEMAHWHAQAEPAKRLLGRIAGVDEINLNRAVANDQIDLIIGELQQRK